MIWRRCSINIGSQYSSSRSSQSSEITTESISNQPLPFLTQACATRFSRLPQLLSPPLPSPHPGLSHTNAVDPLGRVPRIRKPSPLRVSPSLLSGVGFCLLRGKSTPGTSSTAVRSLLLFPQPALGSPFVFSHPTPPPCSPFRPCCPHSPPFRGPAYHAGPGRRLDAHLESIVLYLLRGRVGKVVVQDGCCSSPGMAWHGTARLTMA